MAVLQLKQPEATADGIKGFVWLHGAAGIESRRNWSGLGPAFEMRLVDHGVDRSFCLSRSEASDRPTTLDRPAIPGA